MDLCRATYAGQTSGLTMGDGRSPRKMASHCLPAFSLMLKMASCDCPELCGVARTLSSFKSGWSKEGGSIAQTSNAAPAMTPSLSTRSSASSS